MEEIFMRCPRCGSENINTQVINEIKLKNKHHSILWWIFVSWWWIPFKWIFITLPALFAKIFIPKRQVAINITKTICVCQNCGYSWNR